MSVYINTSTMEYPLYEGDIRLAFPTMGNPFVLPEGYAEVHSVDAPVVERTDVVPTCAPVEQAPQLVNGVWTMTWAVVQFEQAYIDYLKTTIVKPHQAQDTTASGSTPNVIQ